LDQSNLNPHNGPGIALFHHQDMTESTPRYHGEGEKLAQKLDQTYEILNAAKDPSEDERLILTRRGLFLELLPIEPVSLNTFVASEPDDFICNLSDNFPSLGEYVPPKISIAVSPSSIIMPESRGKSLAEQIEMIDEYSKEMIEPTMPTARAVMLPATVLAQADRAYARLFPKEEPLFNRIFANTLDTEGTGRMRAVAVIGRELPEYPLQFKRWDSESGGFSAAWGVVAVGKTR
jgi:hypothetical protein